MILDAITNIKDNFKQKPLTVDMDENSVKDIINQYNELKLGADAFIEKTELSDESMKSYLHTVEGGNATVAGYTSHVNSTNASLGLTGIKAKAAAVGFGLLNAAVTMGISLLASFAIEKLIEGIDNVVNHEKHLAEASMEAKQNIEDLKESFDNLKTSTDDIKERFAQLAQGVDQFNGKNLTLSNEDYEEFLNLSNQLSVLFPSLTKNYDENGNAILNLSGDVNTIVSSLNELVKTEQALANQKMLENLSDVYENLEHKVSGYNEEIEKYQTLSNVLPEDFSINNHGVTSFSFEDTNGDVVAADLYSYIKEQFQKKFEAYGLEGVTATIQSDLSTGGNELEIEGLENTEEYYNKLNKIYDEIRVDIVGKIQEINGSIKSEMNSFNKYIYTWLSSDWNYSQMGEGLQTAIQQILYNSNWIEDLPDSVDPSDWDQVAEWLQKNYLTAINSISNPEYKQKLANLFTLDLKPQDKVDLANELQAYFNENEIKVSLDFITDGDNQGSEQNLVNRMNANRTEIATNNQTGYLKLVDYTEDFDEVQMNAWLTATQGAIDADDAIRKYENSLNRISGGYDFFTDENLEGIDAYKDKISDLGAYLTSLDENHKLSAEEISVLNTKYGITADSVEGYRLAIVNLMNITASSSDIMTILKDAIESCNDAAKKEQLQALYDTLYNLNIEAQQSAQSIYDLETSVSTLESSAALLRELDEVMSKQGFIDTSRTNDILSVFPEMEEELAKFNAGLIDSSQLFDLLEEAYQEDENNYARSIAIKNQYDEEYYDGWLETLPDWIREMAKSYGIDLNNYANLNEQKLALDKEYARRKAMLESAQSVSAKLNETASTSTDIRDAAAAISAYDDVMDAEENLNNILELINAVEDSFTVDTSWEEFGKGESDFGKDGSGSDSSTDIDWTDQSLKVLQEAVDDAQTALDNTHGYDAQITAINELNDALKELRAGYKEAQQEYSDRYTGYLSQLPNGETIRKYIESGEDFDLSPYDSDTAEIIQNAIDAYNDMIEAEDKVNEITKQIKDNNKLEKSKVRQSKYETKLESVEIDLENDTLTAKEKNDLLDKQLKYQKLINDELINQAEYEGRVLEAENLRKENKKLEKENTSEKWKNKIADNNASIDAKNTLLESTYLTEDEIDEIYSDLEDLTENDYKLQFKDIISQLEEGVWDTYISDLKKQYGQEGVGNKKFIQEHLQEIAEHFSHTGMEELYYAFVNSIDGFRDSEYENHANTRSYYINDNNNKIANIQSDINYAGGRGTEKQYTDMKSLHKSNLGYWQEQKEEAESFLATCTEGTAEWDKWNTELQECQENIDKCERSIKDCNIEILKLPLNDIEDELKDIENQLDDIDESIDDFNTYISAASFILDSQLKIQEQYKEAIQDEIDRLEKANELRSVNLELQKAEYNLEKLRNQRTEKVFREGQGFVYESNYNDINDAKQQYDDAVYNKRIYDLNQQLIPYDENIKHLNEIKEKWSGIVSNIQGSIDLNKALAYDSGFFNKVLNGDTSLIQDVQNNMTSLFTSKDTLEEKQEKYQKLQDLINDTIDDYELEAISYELASQRISTAIQTYYPELSERYTSESGKLQEIIDKKKTDADITDETSKDINETVKESNEKLLESYTTLQTDLSKVFDKLNLMLQTYVDNTKTMASAVSEAVSQIQNQINSIASLSASVSITSSTTTDDTSNNKGKKNKSKVDTAGKSHSGLELGYIGEGSTSKDKDAFRYIALDKMDDSELLRLVQKGEAILTPGQVSTVMSNFRNLAQVKVPTILPNNLQKNQSVCFNGDIIIQEVKNADSLAKAIKNQLPNAMLQQLYSNK